MKTKLLTVALLLISVSAFAQKAFDKSTFDALMNRYAQDPVKFLKTETSPDFVFAGSNGSFWNTERTGQVYERNTQTGRTYENVVVRQYGNTGVATGILTHSYVGKASGVVNYRSFGSLLPSCSTARKPVSGKWYRPKAARPQRGQ